MTAPAASDTSPQAPLSEVRQSRGQRAVTWLVFAAFAALSLYVVGKILWGVAIHGRNWTGAVGYVFDSMQYLAWVREMADHFFAGNLFSLEPVVRNYFNPGLGLSALLSLIGVSIPIAYALWIPAGIVAVIWAFTKYARTLVAPGWPLITALALALLYKIPAAEILDGHVPLDYVNAARYSSWDAWPVNWSWGYSLTAIAVALLCLGLLRYGKDRAARRSFSPVLAAIALMCSWLQPWQGAELLAIIAVSELLSGLLTDDPNSGLRRQWKLIATTCIAGVLPLAYYAILGKVDEAWRINGIQANDYLKGASWWTGIAVLLPILILAIPAYLKRPTSFREIALRAWPPIAIAEMLAITITKAGNTAGHSLKGVTLPLAVLAVTGLLPLARRIGSAPVVALGTVIAIALLTIPGALKHIEYQNQDMSWPGRGGYFIENDDLRALQFIERQKEPGAVLAGSLYGTMAPWRTDRQTWVGHETWTPRFQGRSQFNEIALVGNLPAIPQPWLKVSLADFVRSTGSRFVMVDCFHNLVRRAQNDFRRRHHRPEVSLAAQLAPATESIHRFGCSTVYTIRQPKIPQPPNLSHYHLDWRPSDG